MKKNLDAALKDLATQLPQGFYKARTTYVKTGEKILQENPEAKLPDGSPLVPKENYGQKVEVPLPINHYRRLRKAHERQGKQGVFLYCLKYVDPEKQEELRERILNGYQGQK